MKTPEPMTEALYTSIQHRNAQTVRDDGRQLTHSEADRSALLAEVDRLRERVEELEPFEPQLREMHMGPGGWSMTIQQAKSASGAFVAAAKAMLDGYDAENYVEQEVFLGSTTKERYMIIYVRPGKKGPHQLRREADAQVEQLRQRIAELEHDRARRPVWSDGRDLAIKFRNEGATDGEITEGFLGLWGGAK